MISTITILNTPHSGLGQYKHWLVTVVYCLRLLKPENLNQSHYLPQNDQQTPGKSPSFSGCLVL